MPRFLRTVCRTGFYLSEKGHEDGTHSINFKAVDRHYLETYNINLAAGRWFDENDEKTADTDIPQADRKIVYVLNQAAVHKLGFLNPDEIIGKKITTGMGDINAEVIGVLQDFHVASLHSQIEPVVFAILPDYYYEAGIKLEHSKSERDFTTCRKELERGLSRLIF